jgi:hypothetical protein
MKQMCDARINLIKPQNFNLQKVVALASNLDNTKRNESNLLKPEIARDREG